MPDTVVWTTVALPGFHRWPEAPTHRAYLRNTHRHLFRITVHVVVSHEHREIEFHDLQQAIRDWWGPGVADAGSWSCESLARQLGEHLSAQGLTVATVDVSEDGESGATVGVSR